MLGSRSVNPNDSKWMSISVPSYICQWSIVSNIYQTVCNKIGICTMSHSSDMHGLEACSVPGFFGEDWEGAVITTWGNLDLSVHIS